MTMSTWVIISWVFVAIFTGVNIFIFLKLKKASMQMMQMAFPGAKNMNEAVGQMQKMMGAAKGHGGGPGGKKGRRGGPFAGAPQMGAPGGAQSAQLKAAMDMLQQMKRK